MAKYIDKSALVAEIKGYISNYKEIVAKINRNDSTWVDSVSMIDAKIDVLQHVLFFLDTLKVKDIQENPVSEDLEEAANSCSSCIYLEEVLSDDDKEVLKERLVNTFKAGAKWQKEHLWKPADGDDLSEIDREVIALLSNGKVVYAHRPPEYWDGKNIITNEVTRHEPKRYDKGGWNQPNVKWWLDLDLPKPKVEE